MGNLILGVINTIILIVDLILKLKDKKK